MGLKDVETYYPKTQRHVRKWLQKNHISKDAVWFIFYKKHTGKPSVNWSDAVDEALCFGWIDSKAETIDNDSFRQYFCKRKPISTWSKINKQKIEALAEKGLMAQAGLDAVEIAKQNGSWTMLDEVEELTIPPDLADAFEKSVDSKGYFSSLSKSRKKLLLQWIALAKTEMTRQKRVLEIAECAAQQQLPKPFRPRKNGD